MVSFLSLTVVFSDGDDDDEDESVVLINFARVIHDEEEANNPQHNNAKVPQKVTDRLLRMIACYLNNSSFVSQYPKLSI